MFVKGLDNTGNFVVPESIDPHPKEDYLSRFEKWSSKLC